MDSASNASSRNHIAQISDTVREELTTLIEALTNLWDSVGFTPDQQLERTDRVLSHIKILFQNIRKDENKVRKKLLEVIEKNGQEFVHLNKVLDASIPDPDDDLPLIALDKYLRQGVEKLQKVAQERREELHRLQLQEKELCERLIEDPKTINSTSVPSLEDLADLGRRIRTLQQEKVNRVQSFQRLKGRLEELMKQLERRPSTSFEQNVLCEVEDLFTLSQCNLSHLKKVTDEYEQQVKQCEESCLRLRENVRLLYDRLEVDCCERDCFLGTVQGHTPSVQHKLQEELDRLELIKKQNIGRFVNQLRRELEALWELLYTPEEQKQAFAPYSADEYTEAVLEAHDMEVQRLRDYYHETQHIYKKIKQRQELWHKLMELEESVHDPNRLFGNRGGALLKEEKERKKVKLELPRVEKELEVMVAQWEKDNGQAFLVGGKVVGDFILDQWHIYHDQKEQEKLERKNQRNKQTHEELRYGTHSKGVKRRLGHTENLRHSKMSRKGPDTTAAHTTTAHTTTSTPTESGERRKRVLSDSNSMAPPKQPAAHTSTDLSTSNISSYSQFSEGIHQRQERENVRSSAVLGCSKTVRLPVARVSPRRAPPGLPKTPKTLPRMGARRSSRLSAIRQRALTPHTLGRATRTTPSSLTPYSPNRTKGTTPYSPNRTRGTTPYSLNRTKGTTPVSRTPQRGPTPCSGGGLSAAFRSPSSHRASSRGGTLAKWSKLSFLI